MTDAPFPPNKEDVAESLAWASRALADFDAEIAHDPLANSVRSLAYRFSQGLAEESVSLETVRNIAKAVSDDALLDRAETFADRCLLQNDKRRAAIFAALDGANFAGVEHFYSMMRQTLAGIVFTAHPTFAAPRAMREIFAAFVENIADSSVDHAARSDARRAARKRLGEVRHYPDASLSLAEEHLDTKAALVHAQDALSGLAAIISDWAAEKFGAAASEVVRSPISLATWVGYDLDGRTDIHWGHTFRLRLEEKAEQLSRYAKNIDAAIDGAPFARAEALADRLRTASKLSKRQSTAFDGDLENPTVIVAAANALTDDHADKITDVAALAEEVRAVANEAPTTQMRNSLKALSHDIENYGLGLGRIHLRVNAAQVRSTLRADLGLDETRAFLDRTILSTAAARSAAVKARRINMGSVFSERMTARRQFMLCAQFKKHVDSRTPIRFLIAECEAPATVMGAVFLARLYDVDDIVDISPLFETPTAIESGGRFLERLLDEKEYRAYIAKRGRLAIQLGFSDSGRFMGQIPAALAIERLHILLARALEARGLTDIEVIVFNTHGESMGRGAFPGSYTERFDHLLTPWTRAQFLRRGIRLNAESSFQGGDGFLHFHTPALARSTVAQMFIWAISHRTVDEKDQFYRDINFSWDIYRGVKNWQETLFDNPDYHVALSAFAPNLLVKTGSRQVRRQASTPGRPAGPRSMRAIPNNAILQQLGAPMNVAGGFGGPAAREPDRFSSWRQGSVRAASVLTYVQSARRHADMTVLRAYASAYDASFWSTPRDNEAAQERAMRIEIASRLNRRETATALMRLANHFSEDLSLAEGLIFNPLPETQKTAHQQLKLLHALRLAAIMEGFRLAARTPKFSPRHDLTHGAVVDHAIDLEFAGLADVLARIFPLAPDSEDALCGIHEDADGLGEAPRGYPDIHAEIIEPLRLISAIIGEIGVGISHFYNAYG